MTTAAPDDLGRPEPPARPSLRDRKKEQNRRAIQSQAIRLIEQQGYARTTVEQIAEAANVSSSTFFRYYRNKDEAVLSDLVAEGFLQVTDTAPPELSPVGALRHSVARYYATLTDEEWDREQRRTQLVLSTPELHGALMEELVRPLRALTTFVARRLGRAEDDVDVRVYAGSVFGGLAAMILPPPEDGRLLLPVTREEAAVLVDGIFALLDRTLVPPGPQPPPERPPAR